METRRVSTRIPTAVLLVLFASGILLLLVSLSLPWFIFSGNGQSAFGTNYVSGTIFSSGHGRLDATIGSGTVTMWSSVQDWDSNKSDFWFGSLTFYGLILVLLSMPLLYAFRRGWVSLAMVLAGGSMAVSASIISLLIYKPELFVVSGSYIANTHNYVTLLYSNQASMQIGLGLWFSAAGGIVSIGSLLLYCILRMHSQR